MDLVNQAGRDRLSGTLSTPLTFGGTGNLLSEQTYGDYALGIAVDSTGSAYVVRRYHTFSADFPVTTATPSRSTNNAYKQ